MRLHKFPNQSQRGAQFGFNLVELAMVILAIGALAAFAISSYGNTQETRDAAMIQAAQASLQSIISQGSARMDVRPDALAPTAVTNAANASLSNMNGDVVFQPGVYPYRLNITRSGNWATYTIQANGDVCLTGISENLTLKGYQIQTCVLVRQ